MKLARTKHVLRELGISTQPNEKLRREDEKYLKFLMAKQHLFVITDPYQHDHPIVYASPSFCAFTGYSTEEILGRNCRFLQGDTRHTQESALNRIRTVLSLESVEPLSVTVLNYKKDGSPFINQFFLKALVNQHAKVIFYVGVQQPQDDSIAPSIIPSSRGSISGSSEHNSSVKDDHDDSTTDSSSSQRSSRTKQHRFSDEAGLFWRNLIHRQHRGISRKHLKDNSNKESSAQTSCVPSFKLQRTQMFFEDSARSGSFATVPEMPDLE